MRPVALRRYLREQGIADYKLPDRIEIIDAMPLTAVGKIDKQTLRARIAPTEQNIIIDRISS